MKIVVLGCGRIGSAIARDLAAGSDVEVTVVDRSRELLQQLAAVAPVKTVATNLQSRDAIASAIAISDLVVSAVPGFMGHVTLRTIIESGKNVVDIAFAEEDPLQLDELARERDVTAVVDCGVAPGLSNIIAGAQIAQMDRVDKFTCFVGGLPVERVPPFEYKAPFSPIDVIEGYTRPARLVLNGEVVTRPALSDLEEIEFKELGRLEAFNTDGLRTLIKTVSIPMMSEKTLRYPGHVDTILLLRDLGLLAREPVTVRDQMAAPLELTTELLFKHWAYSEGEADLTVMRVEVEGIEDGKAVRREFDMLDYYDEASGVSSMARTTGYTCNAAVQLIASGRYSRPGVSPPEFLGMEGFFPDVKAYLSERGVRLRESTQSG